MVTAVGLVLSGVLVADAREWTGEASGPAATTPGMAGVGVGHATPQPEAPRAASGAGAVRASTPVVAGPRESKATEGPTVGPLLSGAASYVAGTYVWTDYAYDDRGPDTNGRAGGDATYPADMVPNNVADLIQLQLRPTAGERSLQATAVLETLTPTTRPVLGIAFDGDGDSSTGATLPGAWAAATPPGMDRVFVLSVGASGARGTVLVPEGGGARWTPRGTFAVRVDPERNTLEATLPFALPERGLLRAAAAVGYESADGGSWMDGSTPVHDLAFVTAESPTMPYLQSVADAITGFAAGGDTLWQDHRQSAVLAGKADPGAAVANIDLVELRAGVTTLAAPTRKGFHTLLYRSELRLGEGVQGSGNSALFAGPYQPYLIWVPARVRPGLPLVLYLHGSSQTHLSAVNTAHYDPSVRDPNVGLPETTFDFDAVVAWPLGRGPQQGYTGASERDVLDVADDVIGRLALDRERVMLAGLSMGGMGTFRLAQLYPDRWSVAYADVGIDQVDLLGNLTSLPLRFQNGAADYLVNAALALETRARVDAAGTVDYRSWMRMNNHHQASLLQAECLYRESFRRPRVRNPARVRYTADPAMFSVSAETGLRLVYDGAYWVSGMRPAGPSQATVDVTSRAFGYEPVAGPTTRTVHQNATEGRDFCGPNETRSRGRDVWDEWSRTVERVRRPARPVVEGSLTELAAVTLDARRAGVASPGSELHLRTDRTVQLTLAGLRRGTTVSIGAHTARVGPSGTVTVRLAVGANEVLVR